MQLDEVKKKMKILRMLLEAGHRSERALHAVCKEKYSDIFRKPVEMLKLLIYYDADVHKTVNGNTALHIACLNLDQEKIKVLAKSGSDVNQPDHTGRTPLQICTSASRNHCLDHFTDDIIRFLHKEQGADVHVVTSDDGWNLIELACVCYDETKVAIVLYYLSQGLTLQYKLFAESVLQYCGLKDSVDSNQKTTFMSQEAKQLLSVLVMDNGINTSQLQSATAGRLVLNLFGYHNEEANTPDEYQQPDFDMLRILHTAGFVIPLPYKIEQELVESNDETKEMTLKMLQDEMLRIPSLAELSRWAIRGVLGPGLISLQKVDNLLLPKPLIEYVLLLDIIEEKHARTMYDYISGKSMKMICVAKDKTDLYGNEWELECLECSTEESVKLERQKERDETRIWTADFLEKCQKEDSRKAQENILRHPEDWIILDET